MLVTPGGGASVAGVGAAGAAGVVGVGSAGNLFAGAVAVAGAAGAAGVVGAGGSAGNVLAAGADELAGWFWAATLALQAAVILLVWLGVRQPGGALAGALDAIRPSMHAGGALTMGALDAIHALDSLRAETCRHTNTEYNLD